MTPPVRVGTAEAPDGAALWWRADGSGPALLCSNGIGVSTSLWRGLAERFAPTHTVLTWDYRGHGRSPVPEHSDGVTVIQCARDLWTVAERAGVREAVLLGHSVCRFVSSPGGCAPTASALSCRCSEPPEAPSRAFPVDPLSCRR